MVQRRKVGTVLDANLLDNAKAAAAKEGIPLSALFEKALTAYLAQASRSRGGLANATFGALMADRNVLDKIMKEPGVLDA